jgi:hypothetical protein
MWDEDASKVTGLAFFRDDGTGCDHVGLQFMLIRAERKLAFLLDFVGEARAVRSLFLVVSHVKNSIPRPLDIESDERCRKM